ncbi:MAG: hypothetical protein FWD71_19430 [Oscillospiraceae bacterium]|nr:hypothetical protein [Oscillospiraceae bacterium]
MTKQSNIPLKCPNFNQEDPHHREMCSDCGYPVKPIPISSGGKIRFGKYDWYVLDKKDDRALIVTEKVIKKGVLALRRSFCRGQNPRLGYECPKNTQYHAQNRP